MYQRVLDNNGKTKQDRVFRESDSAWIPCVVGNRDYDAFCVYCKENNLTIDDLKVRI